MRSPLGRQGRHVAEPQEDRHRDQVDEGGHRLHHVEDRFDGCLDVRRAAEPMLTQAKTGDHDLREVIEPALASWKYQPTRELWLERLRLPDPPSGELVLAIRGLAALREPEAASRLSELVDSPEVSWPVRLEAQFG